MTRPRRLLVVQALACTALVAALPDTAAGAWTPPQDLGRSGFSDEVNAVASNARGDVVTAFSQSPGIHVARAAPGGRFATAIKLSSDGVIPRVAIDPGGVAIIAWDYEDGSYEEYEDRGVTTCCTGTKVVVWRPGHAPTRARVVRRRGFIARSAQVAAASGRRGVVVDTSDRAQDDRSVRFVPIRLDGRLGKARTVVRRRWVASSLQFVGGRAVVGLVDPVGRTRLAVRSQRASGSFGSIRPFLRVPERLVLSFTPAYSQAIMVADGRGGHVAVLQRGGAPRQFLEVARKPRTGRLRRTRVRIEPADDFDVSRPSVAPDGWVALTLARKSSTFGFNGVGYVAAIRPDGRALVTQLVGVSNLFSLAASVRSGGSGAAGFAESLPSPALYRGHAIWMALAGGAPQAAESLDRSTYDAVVDQAVMTSNLRDRARVVWTESRRVLASRLE